MIQQEMVFDYGSLDSETRIVVQQRTTEIKGLMRRAAQDIVEIGQKLMEIRERLRHNKVGGFAGWLKSEFDWSESAALKMIQVAERFNHVNFTELSIGPSALYLLAAPSTPDEARNELIARAEAGETITHSAARATVEAHKGATTLLEPPPDYLDVRRQVADLGGLLAMDARDGSFRLQAPGVDPERFPGDAWGATRARVAELVAASAAEAEAAYVPDDFDEIQRAALGVAAIAILRKDPGLCSFLVIDSATGESSKFEDWANARALVRILMSPAPAPAPAPTPAPEEDEEEDVLATATVAPPSVTLTPLVSLPDADADAGARRQACALVAALEAALALAREGVDVGAYIFPKAQVGAQARAILDAPQVKLAAWSLSTLAEG